VEAETVPRDDRNFDVEGVDRIRREWTDGRVPDQR
jgi:hypothetical protein